MQLWRSDYAPFLRYAQLQFCRRLIVVPLSTFHRLADVIGDPTGDLIFLFNTARCGSTLLTQVARYLLSRGAQQRTSRTPLLLSIDGTDGQATRW